MNHNSIPSTGNPLCSEKGTAIIVTLLILVLLTLVALTATQTTVTEKAAIRSESIFQQDFYLAESAAMEGVQRLENESSPQELLVPLLKSGANNEELIINVADPNEPDNDLANLDTDGDSDIDGTDFYSSSHNTTNTLSEIDPANETYRMVVQLPITSGNSLALGGSRLYSYLSYGFSESKGGRAMVKVGYKKRF